MRVILMQDYPSAPGGCKHREGAWRMITTTTARYAATFLGDPGQVGRVRAKMRTWLAGCPRADDAVLIASELSANAILHSASRGESFTVRAEVLRDCIWVEVEDLGGTWLCRGREDRPHG